MVCLCGMSLLNKRRTGGTKNKMSAAALIRVNTATLSISFYVNGGVAEN